MSQYVFSDKEYILIDRRQSGNHFDAFYINVLKCAFLKNNDIVNDILNFITVKM